MLGLRIELSTVLLFPRGGRLVGIVRSRTQTMEFSFSFYSLLEPPEHRRLR
jgi:hypothetical protein